MTGVGATQGSYLFAGVSPLPGNIWGGQKPADAGAGFSIDTDTSGATGGVGKAVNQSVAAAAGLALDDVDSLSLIAKSLGGSNPNHLSVITFSLDRSGAVVSGAELDANGDFNLYSNGHSDGSDTKIRMFVPGTESGSDDWSTQAASGLALAAYKLNAVLDQSDRQTQGANVNASA